MDPSGEFGYELFPQIINLPKVFKYVPYVHTVSLFLQKVIIIIIFNFFYLSFQTDKR